MRSVIGKASKKSSVPTMQLNARALAAHPEHSEITFAHEFAHLVDFEINGSSSHGPRWKLIMSALGQAPERTAKGLEIEHLRARQKVAGIAVCACEGKEFKLKPVMFSKISRGHLYNCRKCKQILKIKETGGKSKDEA